MSAKVWRAVAVASAAMTLLMLGIVVGMLVRGEGKQAESRGQQTRPAATAAETTVVGAETTTSAESSAENSPAVPKASDAGARTLKERADALRKAGTGAHYRARLFLAILASDDTRSEADRHRTAVAKALKCAPADIELDQSVHYDGLRKGYWIVFLASEGKADASDIVLWPELQGFDPYLRTAVKRCFDPIFARWDGIDI